MKTVSLSGVLWLTVLCCQLSHAQSLNVTTVTDVKRAPLAITVDSAGNLYVAEQNFVEKITPTGGRTTLLSSDYGEFLGIAVDGSGNVYVTNGDVDPESGNTVLKITAPGTAITLAGSPGLSGSANGTRGNARFDDPTGIALDTHGNLYVADHRNSTIRKITPAGVVSTFAGAAGRHGEVNGAGSRARFFLPTGVAIDGANNVWVLDTGNNTVRKITPAGIVSTIARLPESRQETWYPTGIAVYKTDIYIADQFNEVIRHVTPAGVVNTAAGLEESPGFRDGVGSEARFRHPHGITVDAAGVVYIADTGNEAIRKGVLIGGSGPAESPVLVRTMGHGRITPNYSNAVLELGRAYTIKAKAARGFRFANWVVSTNGTTGTTSTVATLRFVMKSNLTLQAAFTDIARPKITFASPKSRSRLTNGVVTITGAASDNSDVAAVWYQLNGGEWANATGGSNWTALVSLAPGMNTVRAYAIDAAGNISLTKNLRLLFAMPALTSTANSP